MSLQQRPSVPFSSAISVPAFRHSRPARSSIRLASAALACFGLSIGCPSGSCVGYCVLTFDVVSLVFPFGMCGVLA